MNPEPEVEVLMQAEKRIAELEAERDDDSPGTPLGRLTAIAEFAEAHCGHNPFSARAAESTLMDRFLELEAENARLRKALADAPHASNCHSVFKRHQPSGCLGGFACTYGHWIFGPCDCWKAALALTPEATR